MGESTSLPKELLEHVPWENGGHPIWPASSLTIRRNLGKYLFPHKLGAPELSQIVEFVKTALFNTVGIDQPLLFQAKDLTPLEKEMLFEHFLCLEGFQNASTGQAFIVDRSAKLFAQINIQDHLQLQLIDTQTDWQAAWQLLSKLDTELETALHFAFSPQFGYLTSDTGLCGTGLSALAYLHLPALIHTKQMPDMLLKSEEEGVRAIQTEGDIVVLQNSYTLGLSEESLLGSLHGAAMKLIVDEKRARSSLQADQNVHVKDLIHRAFGLITHSVQLQTKEALSALSLIKLGIDLGWITGMTDQKINHAFFKCRRAHLAHSSGLPLNSEELPVKRAAFLHHALSGMNYTL